ncbi:MAG: class I SAM-dependent methyltransferase [Planctomycetales bacterium]
MLVEATRETQYQMCLEKVERQGITSLGLMTNQVWDDDPRRLVFVLARYKFVAKMLAGKKRVLEVGCADAFGTRIVLQEVDHVTAVDFDPVFVRDAQQRMSPEWAFEVREHDMLAGPVAPCNFDAAYCCDVIEHIEPDQELRFVRNLAESLTPDGVAIVGSPSIHSQTYASPQSKAGHVNCKDAAGLKRLMHDFFENVFIFSMNDEVVHTGFTPMAHYLFALCAGRR